MKDQFQNSDEVMIEINEQPVAIENGETKLAGRIFLPMDVEEKVPGVLFVHGWGSKQNGSFEVARDLTKQKVASLTFNLRDHGIEDGKPDRFSKKYFLSDVRAAYDFLAARGEVDPENISIVGSSFGAYLGAILTEERDVKRLLLRAPADYIDDDFEIPGVRGSEDSEVLEWRKKIHNWDETRSLRALHKYDGELLVVESGRDEIVPHVTVQSFVDAPIHKDKVRHVCIEEAEHSISRDEKSRQEFNSIVKNWVK
ncbi:MAG: alpha/beta fold hydrolase [Patescibacteria group bacterium]